ncbi:MAG TPA: Zn-ribbon domain-containing OB-fold protein [Pseudonocardia sp.]|nr:Zn-ribbon domain-containing OB-fold protein [Pseudonocardia sp.]
MSDHSKPLPEISDENRPFWEGTRREQLLLQRCARCGHLRYPISHVCPECLEAGHEWVPVSGRGEVYSSIVFHQVYHPAFADDVPYNVSLVQLDEGPRMFSNVVGVPPGQVKVGDRVRVVFDPVNEEVTVPRFTPEHP